MKNPILATVSIVISTLASAQTSNAAHTVEISDMLVNATTEYAMYMNTAQMGDAGQFRDIAKKYLDTNKVPARVQTCLLNKIDDELFEAAAMLAERIHESVRFTASLSEEIEIAKDAPSNPNAQFGNINRHFLYHYAPEILEAARDLSAMTAKVEKLAREIEKACK